MWSNWLLLIGLLILIVVIFFQLLIGIAASSLVWKLCYNRKKSFSLSPIRILLQTVYLVVHGEASIPLCSLSHVAAISVELSEVLGVSEATADGEFTRLSPYSLARDYDGIDPIDNDCSGAKCLGTFTRVSCISTVQTLLSILTVKLL